MYTVTRYRCNRYIGSGGILHWLRTLRLYIVSWERESSISTSRGKRFYLATARKKIVPRLRVKKPYLIFARKKILCRRRVEKVLLRLLASCRKRTSFHATSRQDFLTREAEIGLFSRRSRNRTFFRAVTRQDLFPRDVEIGLSLSQPTI